MINTQKIFDKTIQEIAKVVKLINEDGKDVDSKIISDMNDDISDLHATLFDGSNDFVELKDLKNYIKDVIGKDYFSDKRCWEYLYDSVYEVFIDIPNEFDESMQTGLGMAQQLPTNSVYDGELDDLYNGGNKKMKKLINGLSVDDACDIALESNFDIDGKEHDENINKINALSDAWELYNKSWEKFNDTYTIGDIEEMYNEIKDLFGKKGSKVIEGWIEDIDDVFYSNKDITSLDLNFGFKGNDMFESKKKITNKRLEEKKIDSEDKKQALADYLEVDIEEIEDGYDDNHFEVNGDEYMVLTEDESYDEYKDWEMSLIDDLGLEAFSENFQEHILENCINEDFFNTVAEEEADFYISEMDDEELLEYAHDHKIAKDIDDIDDENFDRTDIEEDCKDEYEEEILKQGMSDYFESIYGRGWAKEMKDTLEKEIDWEQVLEDLYDWDDRYTLWGSMAGYDGVVHELDKVNGEWLFAYRTN